MKNAVCIGGALLVAVVILGGSVVASGAETTKKTSVGKGSSDSSAGVGISVKTENGQTTVTYKGKEVFTGRTKGMVTAKASSENGTEYAAAFDGKKVLWENVPGAAKHVKEAGGDLKLPELKLPAGFEKKPPTDV